jgi:HSP20 family protein
VVVQVQHRQKSSVSEMPGAISRGTKSAQEPFRMVLRRPVMSGYACIPAIDLFTRDDALVLRMDLPGIRKDDVEILATENRLSISGRRHPMGGINREDYRINEVTYGNFSRTFNLPVIVDSSKIEANLEDGILEVTLPKVSKDKVTSVAIRTRSH